MDIDHDGLPFKTEGYERAKNILQSVYGRTSERVNAYIQNLMSLPVITGSQPKKVHEFYKKLVYNVQSLETLGKLRDVAENTRAVLDKLRGIKAQLLQALKRWKDINTRGKLNRGCGLNKETRTTCIRVHAFLSRGTKDARRPNTRLRLL